MDFKNRLRFQKCLYFNIYLYVVWFIVTGVMLSTKLNLLGHLTKYLSLTVYTLLTLLEGVRVFIGYYGNMSSGVPELAGFLMLTSLMQLPLVSFFLFNPYLLSTPTEIILHAMLWLIAIAETVYGFIELKHVSALASSVYLSQYRNRNISASK